MLRPAVYLGSLSIAILCVGIDRWLARGPDRGRARWVVCIACFLMSFVVYLYCLAPGLAGDDSAEYALQAYRLGLAHLSGYPFYLMMGKLFESLVPASPAYGLNLMSATFSSLAVALVAYIISREGYGERLALVLAMQFAFVQPFWSQAVIAEVHNVSTAVGLSLIVGLLVWRDRGAGKLWGALLGLLAGLATGVYFPIVMIAPALFFFIACADGSAKERAVRLLTSGAAFVLGVGLVAALIISKARHDPPLGTIILPVDLQTYYYAVSGKQEELAMPAALQILKNLLRLPYHFFICFLGVTFVAGLAGLIRPPRLADLPMRILLVLILAGNAAYVYALQPSLWFLMTNTSYAAFAIAAAGGYAWLFSTRWTWTSLTQRALPLLPAAAVFLFHSGLVVPIPSGYASVDRHDERRYDEVSDRLLSTLPPDAVALIPWEYATAVQYKQTVFAQRPDLQVYELRDGVWYGQLRMESWREFVRINMDRRPVFLGIDDPEVRRFADLTPTGDGLWRVTRQKAVATAP